MQSPISHLKSKRTFRRKPQSEEEMKMQALKEMYRFYARQHIRHGINFDELRKEEAIDQGEFIAFCKDFKLSMPKSKMIEIYKKI